jgi:hypothetical protein
MHAIGDQAMRHARLILLGLAAACLVLPSIEALAQQGEAPPAAVGQPGATGAPPKATGPVEPPSSDPRDFNGLWNSVLMSPKGLSSASNPFALQDVPVLPKTKAIVDKVAALVQAGHPVATISTSCRAVGIESTLFNLQAAEIVQTANNLYIIFSAPKVTRNIRLNRMHPQHVALSYRGDSVGHWEGNALVVDTVGFNGIGELDEAGKPIGKQLHTVERITKSADGRALDFDITLIDPEYYSTPFTVKRKWVWTNERQLEYDCAESPRADSQEITVYLNPLYRPTCARVEGKGMAPSRVICRKPEHTKQ